MQVRFRCGSCGTSVQVDSSHAGKKAKCPKCGTVLQIPSIEKIAAVQAQKSGATPASKVAATQAAPAKAPQPMREDIQGLSDFKPQFDEEDFDFEPATPPAETAALPPSLPAYYRPPEKAATVTYAGFWKRFAAAFIDNVALWIISFVIGCAIAIPLALNGVDIDEIGWMFNIGDLAITWLYFAFMESSYYQATYGKQMMGIKVTDLKGDPISFGRASARYFAKILSVLTLGIGYIMIAFTPKKQGLHDMIAGCLVVNR